MTKRDAFVAMLQGALFVLAVWVLALVVAVGSVWFIRWVLG